MQESLRVLVVDDDPAVTDLLVEGLKIQGFDRVERASEGREAVEKYRMFLPQVVIMDLAMPVMDGYQASLRIKSLDPAARIIILTGNPDDPRAGRILSEGLAEGLFQKPVRLKDLRRIIQAHAAETPLSGVFSTDCLPAVESVL
jgi:CheY-like chemotaxis protein